MKDFFNDIKKQIIAGVGVVIATVSTLFIDVVKEKLGLVEENKPAKIEKIVEKPNPTQNVIINIPEQKEKTIVKKVYVKPVVKKTETEKRKEEGLDW